MDIPAKIPDMTSAIIRTATKTLNVLSIVHMCRFHGYDSFDGPETRFYARIAEILSNQGHVSDMEVLLIQKEGIDLYDTFVLSETSRKILRFYRPDRLPYGVKISTSSLGGALSILDEIRWYIRRYVREVIIGVGDGIYFTHSLAQDIYERSEIFSPDWKYKSLYILSSGRLMERRPLDAREENKRSGISEETDDIFEVMMTDGEYLGLINKEISSDPETLGVDDLLSSDPEA